MIVVINKEKLREDIIRAGFTITSLAKNIGCSKAHISSIVNHERNPSATIAVKICEQIKDNLILIFLSKVFTKRNNKFKQYIQTI